MQIEYWPLTRPKPYARNARKWTAAAVEKVASSIREFGWRQPIVCDAADVIIIGHLRLAAAKLLESRGQLAPAGQVPVHVAADLDAARVKALRLADNRTHQEAEWDETLLGPELIDLRAMDIDLTLTGFDSLEIDKLTAAPDDGRADECPPVPECPVSRLGDLWLLGEHRVLCGDSTASDAVSRLLSPASGIPQPFLMVTDPPYGVEYQPKWRLEAGINKAWQKRAEGIVSNDDRADWRAAWSLFPGAVVYVWHAGGHAAEVAIGLSSERFDIRAQIIWAKPVLVVGRGAYHWQHEPCWYAVRQGQGANWKGDRKQSTLWQIANMHPTHGDVDDGKTVHATQKPVELMRRPIRNHTTEGEAVYDPFLGSGTTLIACDELHRICYGLEIEPKYVDVIVQRWQTFTGKQAVLDGSHGLTFEQVKAGRRMEAEDATKEDIEQRLEARV